MAQDLEFKRRRLSENAIVLATRLADTIQDLEQLRMDRGVVGAFDQDEMILVEGFDHRHLSPALLDTLFDAVLPRVYTAYLDAGNSGQVKQILSEMRK